MKKILLLLLTVPLILSCSSDDDTGVGVGSNKLKSKRSIADYRDENGYREKYDYKEEYFYGSNGFVEKIKGNSFLNELGNEYFYYEGDKVVRRLYKSLYGDSPGVEEVYSYKDGLIVESLSEYKRMVTRIKYYYDSSKNLIKEERYEIYLDTEDTYESSIEYEYRDGNVQTEKLSYKHDYGYKHYYQYDNNFIPTKYSFPDAYKKIRDRSKNNITKYVGEDEGFTIEHKYEYNSTGFPVKETYKDGNVTVLYEYY